MEITAIGNVETVVHTFDADDYIDAEISLGSIVTRGDVRRIHSHSISWDGNRGCFHGTVVVDIERDSNMATNGDNNA